jgi:predicted DNA-binding transcriptional regulator AlpA
MTIDRRVSVNNPTRIEMDACATISLSDVAIVLGIHRSTASQLYRRGEFPVPVLQIGHRRHVTKIHLERFLLAGATDTAAADSGDRNS